MSKHGDHWNAPRGREPPGHPQQGHLRFRTVAAGWVLLGTWLWAVWMEGFSEEVSSPLPGLTRNWDSIRVGGGDATHRGCNSPPPPNDTGVLCRLDLLLWVWKWSRGRARGASWAAAPEAVLPGLCVYVRVCAGCRGAPAELASLFLLPLSR